MDYKHRRIIENTPSLLRCQEDQFSNKILSRNSSVGCSSRVYYRGSIEGVPFQWERQPGTPKNPPLEGALPPLSPPPAVLSLGLPKPCLPEPKTGYSHRIKFRFWKRSKKNDKRYGMHDSDKFSSFDGFSSEGEYMASTPRDSSSSSSSSLPLGNECYVQSSKSHRVKEWSHGPFACGPWKFRGIVISVERRG